MYTVCVEFMFLWVDGLSIQIVHTDVNERRNGVIRRIVVPCSEYSGLVVLGISSGSTVNL